LNDQNNQRSQKQIRGTLEQPQVRMLSSSVTKEFNKNCQLIHFAAENALNGFKNPSQSKPCCPAEPPVITESWPLLHHWWDWA